MGLHEAKSHKLHTPLTNTRGMVVDPLTASSEGASEAREPDGERVGYSHRSIEKINKQQKREKCLQKQKACR